MNILIKNIDCLMFNDNIFKIFNSDIYIVGDRIAAINETPKDFIAEKTINGTGKLLIPGLVNCHTHSYMSLFRNCADDLCFSDWLFGRILPLEDKLTPEDIYYGALLACIEMIKTGTTCFLDMHQYKIETARAAKDIGMRAVISRGLVDSDGIEGGMKRIEQAKEEMRLFKDCDRLTFMVAPHAVYTCSKEYLEIVRDFAKDENLPIHIHLSETLDEVTGIKDKYSCSPVEYINDLGIFENKTVAAHCVHISDNDIDIFKKNNVSVATNPKSNLKLANGFAPLTKLFDAGVNVCIGTDSAASNNNLNMFSDMNYAALLQKGLTRIPTVMNAHQVIKAATVSGGKALSLDVGEIAVGKKADLAIVDLNNVQFYPRANTVSALVYSANGSEVETTIVNGKVLMENHHLTTIDEEEVYNIADKIYERLNKN